MATGKKFYWIKLRKDFMTSDTVDFLMSQRNGAQYVVLYQMLCFMCIDTKGELSRQIGEIIMPFDVDKIQRDCKYFSRDTITIALGLFKKLGLIYEQDTGGLVISDFVNLVGCETDYAVQKRLQNQTKKKSVPMLSVGQCVYSGMESGVDVGMENNVENFHTLIANEGVDASVEGGVENFHTEIRDKRLESNNKNIMRKEEAGLLFEELWQLYPCKKGKGQVSVTAKQRLLKVGRDEMIRAINRFKSELEKDKDWRKPQNGSTFFNSGYVDYLDANYVPDERPVKGQFNQFMHQNYDFEKLEREILSN